MAVLPVALQAKIPIPSESSLAPSAPTVVVSPLLYLVLHFSDRDTHLGLWQSRRGACRSWAVAAVADYRFTLQRRGWGWSVCIPWEGSAPCWHWQRNTGTTHPKRALFTLKRALLLPLPSSAPDHVYT